LTKLWDLLSEREKVGLDSAVFIYYLNRQKPYFPLCLEILKRIEAGRLRGVISVVNEMEMLAIAPTESREQMVNDVERLLDRLTNLDILSVDRAIARRAAELRAHARVRGLDALVAATALSSGCGFLLGNDAEFARRVTDITYILLDDFVETAT